MHSSTAAQDHKMDLLSLNYCCATAVRSGKPSSGAAFSKRCLHPKLHDPGLGRSIGGWAAVCVRSQRSPDLTKPRAALIVIGRSKVRMVGDIENVCTKLERNSLEARVFDRGDVGIKKSGAAQATFANVAIGADSIWCEIGGIDPLADNAGMRTVAELGLADVRHID